MSEESFTAAAWEFVKRVWAMLIPIGLKHGRGIAADLLDQWALKRQKAGPPAEVVKYMQGIIPGTLDDAAMAEAAGGLNRLFMEFVRTAGVPFVRG